MVGVHGLRGAFKVRCFADKEAVLQPGSQVLVRGPGKKERCCTLTSSGTHGRSLLVRVEGVEDREEAQSLVGRTLWIPRSHMPPLEEGEYYWADIVGLEVVTAEGRPLGHVASIIETGSNDVYVVRDRQGKGEILIPALDWVICSIDLEKRRMLVRLPEGL